MKEHPILFSTPMVQAILAGRKTMTRRIVKPQPDDKGLRVTNVPFEDWHGKEVKCPYGQPGDLLWVRETFAKVDSYPEPDVFGLYLYKSMGDTSNKWTPSIFMPRAASRITLKVTHVRVERLQDISGQDACNEGIINKSDTHPADEFADLWESINGKGSWKANPWVWVIEFEKLRIGFIYLNEI